MIQSPGVLVGLVLVVGSGSLFAQTSTRAVPREFEHVRLLGRALSEFKDDRLQIVAAYYHSQSNHNGPWLLIELGALGFRPTRIDRNQIEIVTPSGRVVPLSTQARWAAQPERNALLLQQASSSRHQLSSYFRSINGLAHLRFFIQPSGAGTVLQSIDLAPNELAVGDLLFESPTRLWDKGTHALVIRYDGNEVVLPIDLR
jgi:hypothetical protein